ncbi:Endophilin-A1, partial [Ophiophagus hannah]
MADQGSMEPTSAKQSKQSPRKARSASKEAANKIKAKALYSRKPTRAEERRQSALEKQFSRAQKQADQERATGERLNKAFTYLAASSLNSANFLGQWTHFLEQWYNNSNEMALTVRIRKAKPSCLNRNKKQEKKVSEKVGGAEGTKLDEDFKEMERAPKELLVIWQQAGG